MSNWISVNDIMPEEGTKVIIVRDVRKWSSKRPITISIADVGYLDEMTRIGGPNSLTGYTNIKGIYFSVPAILHPESVTHWQPLPEAPNK